MKDLIGSVRRFFNPPKNKTVLVIDDADVDRAFVARVISKHYKVIEASSGRAGIEAARQQRPDLVVLDYMMPEMNGPEVCRILKQENGMQDVPVIFLTGLDTPQTVIEGLEEGAEAYLIKPITARDLLGEVDLRINPVSRDGKDS